MGFLKGAPKEEKQQQQETWSNLLGIGKTAQGESAGFGKQGKAATGDAMSYFKRLLSGDRTAVAPAANAAVETSDAQKREQAKMGTARGGGANAGNQKRESDLRGQIMSLFGKQQEGAAKGLQEIGATDLNAMLQSLGLGAETESTVGNMLTSDINQKNASAHKLWSSIIGGAAKLATGGLG